MNRSVRTGMLVVLLVLVGLASHALPHPMGFSTVGALGMVAAAYLPRRIALLPVLATILIADAFGGFYEVLAMSFVYIGHLAATLATAPVLASLKARTVGIAACVSATVFYLFSNLTPMAMGFYPNTAEGWALCYANALPFLLRGILGNLVYGGLAFGFIALIGAGDAHRLAAAEHH